VRGREGQRGGGIYTIKVDNPIGHVGIVDFEGIQNKTLFFNNLDIAEGDYLVIKNLGSNTIARGRPNSWGGKGNLYLQVRNIAIEVDGKLMSIRHYWPGKYWWCEWTLYDKIVSTDVEWVPLPEPGTYGALFGALGVARIAFRRRRADKAAFRVST